MGWIIAVLEDSIVKSILSYKTSREIQIELGERYDQRSNAHMFALQEEMNILIQTPNMSIFYFFTKIKILWDKFDGLNLRMVMCLGHYQTRPEFALFLRVWMSFFETHRVQVSFGSQTSITALGQGPNPDPTSTRPLDPEPKPISQTRTRTLNFIRQFFTIAQHYQYTYIVLANS